MMVLLRARVALVLVWTLSSLAAASVAPIDLDEAIDLAVTTSSDVMTRSADAAAAERDVQRAERDPLATPFERRQLEHALASAMSDLAAARSSAATVAFNAVTRVIERSDAVTEARQRADIAATNLAVARVRLEAGAITPMALDQAVHDATAAERSADNALADLDLAWLELATVLGLSPDEVRARGLAPLPDALPAVPDLAAGLAGLAQTHAGVANAHRTLDIATLRAAGVAHAGSAPNTIADARETVRAAERRVSDVLAGAEQSLRTAHQALAAASGRLEDALAVDRSAAATLEAQRVRHDAGELSPLAWAQAELDRSRVASALRSATHAAWSAQRRYTLALLGH